MLHRNENNDGIYIVAHCRKQGGVLSDGNVATFGDIAVIQYNSKSGATCFYQALDEITWTLPTEVDAPSLGTSHDGSGVYPWSTPKETSEMNCIACHDNGPFVRSPYLAQLSGIWPYRNPPPPANEDYLPGTHPTNGEATSWNDAKMPYTFVGLDFQKWEAYHVSLKSTENATSQHCTSCHSLGISKFEDTFPAGGSARFFSVTATNPSQTSKVDHSSSSPIWMKLDSIFYDEGNIKNAVAISNCADSFSKGIIRPECHVERFARGNTCGVPGEGIINGKTNSTDTGYKDHNEIELGCEGSPDCPPAFYYWTSIHGPFFQSSPSSVPIDSEDFRGSYLRIISKNNKWVVSQGFDNNNYKDQNRPSMGGPGGTYSWITFNGIGSVPDSANCIGALYSIVDPFGSQSSTTKVLYSPASNGLGILSGFIGNVANYKSTSGAIDFLRVMDVGTRTYLRQDHSTQAYGNKWLKAEAWGFECPNWSTGMIYAAKDIVSTSDVQLVPSELANNVRCYISGIAGDWSRPRIVGNVRTQAFAEIYQGTSKEWRLRVYPTGHDGVSAYASCIRID